MGTSPRVVEVLALGRLPGLIADSLDLEPKRVRVVRKGATDLGFDFGVETPAGILLVDVVGNPVRANLESHWASSKKHATKTRIPLLAVPFMTESARSWCAEHRINWFDFSGNASVRAPGLHIRVEGNPNPYAPRGRPSSVFERRSSRLARTLLQQPGRSWSVLDCATATGLDRGHVSRIVARLVEDQLLVRDERRHFQVKDAASLLEAWRNATDFSKHQVLRGHIPARSGTELLHLVSERLEEAHLRHAATGLGAAWLYDHFAGFRLVTVFLREWPTQEHLEHLHFSEDAPGGNVWLTLPNDDGVFEGGQTIDHVPCVHPVQVYVDLKDQPERAAEAAEHLRANPVLLGGPVGTA